MRSATLNYRLAVFPGSQLLLNFGRKNQLAILFLGKENYGF